MSDNTPAVFHLKGLCTITISQYIIEVDIDDGTYTKKEIELIQSQLKVHSEGKEFLILINCQSPVKVKLEGLRALASEKAMQYGLAKAYVLRSRHQRVMSRLFKLLFRPSRPIKFFENRQNAREWLLSLIN